MIEIYLSKRLQVNKLEFLIPTKTVNLKKEKASYLQYRLALKKPTCTFYACKSKAYQDYFGGR